MTLDLATLWDFSDAALSERRFRAALESTRGDDALVLMTQIARTYGLRGDFAGARAVLAGIAAEIEAAGPEPRVRWHLELGRTDASAAHPPGTADPERARPEYDRARALASAAGLDALAVDAIHMLAFVDTAPTAQLEWGRAALAIATSSTQPAARRWEPSLRHNIGCALSELGRDSEALDEFRRAVTLREQGSDAEATRVAHWMVARTLRRLGRLDEALAIQQRLERECTAADAPDPHVFAELALLHRERGEEALAARYEALAGR